MDIQADTLGMNKCENGSLIIIKYQLSNLFNINVPYLRGLNQPSIKLGGNSIVQYFSFSHFLSRRNKNILRLQKPLKQNHDINMAIYFVILLGCLDFLGGFN